MRQHLGHPDGARGLLPKYQDGGVGVSDADYEASGATVVGTPEEVRAALVAMLKDARTKLG